MSTQCKFRFLEAKDVELRFDGDTISTDVGLSVFIEWMHNEEVLESFAEVLDEQDRRDENRTDHGLHRLLRLGRRSDGSSRDVAGIRRRRACIIDP